MIDSGQSHNEMFSNFWLILIDEGQSVLSVTLFNVHNNQEMSSDIDNRNLRAAAISSSPHCSFLPKGVN